MNLTASTLNLILTSVIRRNNSTLKTEQAIYRVCSESNVKQLHVVALSDRLRKPVFECAVGQSSPTIRGVRTGFL